MDDYQLKQYILEEYGGILGNKKRMQKNRSYYADHLRALEMQKEEEEKENREIKQKMINMGGYL